MATFSTRTKSIAAAALLSVAGGTVLAAGPAAAAPARTAPAAAVTSTTTTRSLPSEAQLQEMVRLLDKLPADLKNANPRTTPNYEARVNAALAKIMRAEQGSRLARGSVASVNWLLCGWEVAKFAIQIGFPASRIVSTLREAVRIYGSIRRVIYLIRLGYAMDILGEEGVKIIEQLAGIEGILRACA